jgi:hypothetical protein
MVFSQHHWALRGSTRMVVIASTRAFSIASSSPSALILRSGWVFAAGIY